MRYHYFYQTSENKSADAWIDAKDRNDAYAKLRKQGVKPYKLLGKDPLAWKRWAAIGALSVLVAGLTTWILLAPRPAVATVEERAQLYGDPAIIQQLAVDGWRKTFADAGDAWLARHAIPAATCDCKSVVEDAKQRRSGSGCARREAIGLAERVSANPEGAARARAPLPTLGVSPNATILPISSDDPPELAKMKRMVNCMKIELKEFLAAGESVEDYMLLCDERLETERGLVSAYRKDFEILIKKGGDIEDAWEKKNAELRSMGLPTLPMPQEEPLSSN